MIIFKQTSQLRQHLGKLHAQGNTTGFVPTMGALHKGHLALISGAKEQTDLVICSIFVNPTQFNDPKDFEKYPNTLEQDILALESAGTDILFLPLVAEMYPEGLQNLERYDLGFLETVLEGQYRPGHFQGVCQVMQRLLTKVAPDKLFMGQKDYQQCMVVKRLLELMQSATELIPCPTIREADGLAMSSRNMRLPAGDRPKAVTIYQALSYIRERLKIGELKPLTDHARNLLSTEGFKVDYVAIADAGTLAPVFQWDGQTPLVALVAAFLGEVRLIDNMVLTTGLEKP